MAGFSDLPPEILRLIAQLIYLDHLPRSLFRCIDPHGLPSTYPDGRLISSTQPLTQSTLHALCLTSSSCYHAAKPLLWRRLQIRLPYSFLLLLRSLGVSRLAEAYEEHYQTLLKDASEASSTDSDDDGRSITADVLPARLGKRKGDEIDLLDFNAMLAAVGLARVSGKAVYVDEKLALTGADEGVELIWQEEYGGSHRFHVTLSQESPERDAIHRFPRVLDFSTFTTQGMRRSVGEGQDARFVTPSKLLALITAVNVGLMAFGASSSMDSALSLEVLEALLFRNNDEVSTQRHRKLRGVSIERSRDRGEQRARPKRLEALDLCGCISARFEAALRKFVGKHLRPFSHRTTDTVLEEEDDDGTAGRETAAPIEERRGRPRARRRNSSQHEGSMGRSASAQHRTPSALAKVFTSVERLSLHGVHFAADIISPFVLAFPRLTHLDLAGTKIEDDLLDALGACPDVELESLSLARCTRITSRAITDLIVDSTVCADLVELSLEGSILFPTPLTQDDLRTILTTAPCMRSGNMRYLDLGGCGMNDSHIGHVPPQPSLLDLGLSATPRISLAAIAEFLTLRAPNVQVLELVESCFDPGQQVLSVMRLNMDLLEPCTMVPQMSISEQLRMMGFSKGETDETPSTQHARATAKTNLRVIGLSTLALHSVGGALGSWRVVLGKGRRGWLVDLQAGPNPEAEDQDISGTTSAPSELAGLSLFSESSMRKSSSRDAVERGRQAWRGEPSGAFEPETPPRRLSRSPSVQRRSGSKDGPHARTSSSLLRRATPQSQSRSRTRHPVIREDPLHQSSARFSQEARQEMKENASLQTVTKRAHIIRDLPLDHPRVQFLKRLATARGHVPGSTGWHSKKMEVLLGMGMMGRESGLYAYAAYQA